MSYLQFEDEELVGTRFGDIGERLPEPRPETVPARKHGLFALRRFLSLLVFARRNKDGLPPIRFHVPFDDVHTFQPDQVEDVQIPAIGIRPARGMHDSRALGPAQIDESTVDVFCKGTALVCRGDWIEQVGVEVLGEYDPHRDAILAGIQEALTLGQESYALRLRMDTYYRRIAVFELDESEVVEDDGAFKNRRRADLYLTMRVPEVTLVRVVPFRGRASVAVLSPQVGE